jgi:hypothetical protein
MSARLAEPVSANARQRLLALHYTGTDRTTRAPLRSDGWCNWRRGPELLVPLCAVVVCACHVRWQLRSSLRTPSSSRPNWQPRIPTIDFPHSMLYTLCGRAFRQRLVCAHRP